MRSVFVYCVRNAHEHIRLRHSSRKNPLWHENYDSFDIGLTAPDSPFPPDHPASIEYVRVDLRDEFDDDKNAR